MAVTQMIPVNVGIEEKERKVVSDNLCKLLADTYTLYLKTQNFHWNVTGPQFYMFHEMFEKQYKDLLKAVDEVAERIRALGYPAPASCSEFTQLSSIHEEKGVSKTEDMLRLLAEGHETIARNIRSMFPQVQKANDVATENMLGQHLEDHEKHAWILRSSL